MYDFQRIYQSILTPLCNVDRLSNSGVERKLQIVVLVHGAVGGHRISVLFYS